MTQTYIELGDTEKPKEDTCFRCNGTFTIPELKKATDNNLVCIECFENKYFKCYNCNDVYDNDEKSEYNNDLYCDDCFSDCFATCEDCEESIPSDDVRVAEERYICETCFDDHYFTCQECNTAFHNDKNEGDNYCTECYWDTHFTCDECADVYLLDENVDDEENERNLCPECGNTTKHPKKYIPSETFIQTLGIKTKYGIEIECIKTEGTTTESSEGWSHCSDGSIEPKKENEEGVEYKTKILQGDKGLSLIKEHIDKLEDHYINATCGFHVHVDLSDLTETQITNVYRFMAIWDNSLFLLMPKSRHGNQFCDYLRYVPTNISSFKTYRGRTRYHGTNIQAYWKHKTIEFRYHSGTINYTRIKQWLLLCLLMVEEAKSLTFGLHLKQTPKATWTNLSRMFKILGLSSENRAYWQGRYHKFNIVREYAQTRDGE